MMIIIHLSIIHFFYSLCILMNLIMNSYHVSLIICRTNKVRDQTFTMQFLENVDLLVK